MSRASGGTAELRALTGARGVAAWVVVLYHIRSSIAGLPVLALGALSKGYLAVDFFFLLSGFVMWITWRQRLSDGDAAVVLDFLRRRAARIWPLHLLLLSGALALALLLVATGRPDVREYPFAQLPLHLLLLQNWGFTRTLAWNEPAWSISAEFGAYLLFPLLVRTADFTRWSAAALLAAAAALLALLYVAADPSGLLSEDITHTGLTRCVAEFSVGSIVAALWSRSPGGPWTRAAALACGLTVVRAAGLPETLVVPALLAAVLLALARSAGARGNPLEGRATHYLGSISFATYLSHMLLWRLFKMALVEDAGAVRPALILLYLSLVGLASVLLHDRVEVPAQRWLAAPRRRDGRLRLRPTAPG